MSAHYGPLHVFGYVRVEGLRVAAGEMGEDGADVGFGGEW